MNFRSEVSSCISRPIAAMVWNYQIESATSIADLKTTYSITVPSCRQGAAREESSFIQKLHKKKRLLTGRQVACMIFEYFKFSDTDESVLDFDEILKVELKNDNVKSFDSRWDETIIAMKKQPDEEIVDNFFTIVS